MFHKMVTFLPRVQSIFNCTILKNQYQHIVYMVLVTILWDSVLNCQTPAATAEDYSCVEFLIT